MPGLRALDITYRPDFRLIPQDEEKEFIGDYKITNLGDEVNILPKYYSVPPLMARYLQRHRSLAYGEKLPEDTATKKANYRIPYVYIDPTVDTNKEENELFWITNKIADDDGPEEAQDKRNIKS